MTDDELRAKAGMLSKEELAQATAIIEAAIARRSAAGQSAIQGYTKELGGLWSGAAGQTKAAYDQAFGKESAVNSALADRLGSFGQNLGGQASQQLTTMGAPPSVQQQVAGGAQLGAQGAANAGFAQGSAGLEMLNAQSAAGQTYAAQMPGIAGLTGLQSSKQLEAQLNKELADQLGSAARDSTSSYNSVYQHLLDQELQKAIAKQSGLQDNAKLKADSKYKADTMKYKLQKDAYNRQLQRQKLGISKASVKERARHDGISETQAQARIAAERQREEGVNARAAASRHDANRRQTKWKVDANGNFVYRWNPKTKRKERVPLPAKGKGKGRGGDGL